MDMKVVIYAGGTYRTRNGDIARVLSVDKDGGNFSIKGKLIDPEDGSWCETTWTPDGRILPWIESDGDIMTEIPFKEGIIDGWSKYKAQHSLGS